MRLTLVTMLVISGSLPHVAAAQRPCRRQSDDLAVRQVQRSQVFARVVQVLRSQTVGADSFPAAWLDAVCGSMARTSPRGAPAVTLVRAELSDGEGALDATFVVDGASVTLLNEVIADTALVMAPDTAIWNRLVASRMRGRIEQNASLALEYACLFVALSLGQAEVDASGPQCAGSAYAVGATTDGVRITTPVLTLVIGLDWRIHSILRTGRPTKPE